MIAATGPTSLAEYMAVCLTDPQDGYYSRREAIGSRGDFITAPQVSQMFGEIICIWCVATWRAMGGPPRFVLAEAGPGTGALMADLLRAARRFPDFAAAARLAMIETSPTMIARQRAALAGSQVETSWTGSLADLPHGPLILIANEFLDALPIRQFVKSGPVWRERCVGLDDSGSLCWRLGSSVIETEMLPEGADCEPDGAVAELSPVREAWIAALAGRLSVDGGAALLIDYGHAAQNFGDTFQAVRAHAYADPLAEPGLADLTAHVDFTRLRQAALDAGAIASDIVDQGEFLVRMGILERAGQLGSKAGAGKQAEIRKAVNRLAHPDEMGSLFKVLALCAGVSEASIRQIPPFSEPPAES